MYWQASSRSRGSISAQSMPLQRHRTSSTITSNRLRSDSNRTQNQFQDTESVGDLINHIIEPRARTAQLPPVMVSRGIVAKEVLACRLLAYVICCHRVRTDMFTCRLKPLTTIHCAG
jgi:hypothetical protein